MYAIVRTGGKQYRVERGQRLLVERLAVKEGAEVSLEPLLYRSEEAVLDKDGLAKVQVSAKVIEHVRGPKLRVFKFKPKRGYRRRTGHRQDLTRIEVTDITTRARRAPAGEAPEKAPPKARTSEKAPAKAAAKAPAKPRASKASGEAKASPKAKPAPAGKASEEGKAVKPARPAKAKKDSDGS
ncbi:MAG TPA: 50S ribosomal protein L21 [Solirubrobacteraceae bacterium]|jgi:large subunit ribosomal protein L21|nr:50S ribosomal protein L21 [Solirubrobacteraceae bacterium]